MWQHGLGEMLSQCVRQRGRAGLEGIWVGKSCPCPCPPQAPILQRTGLETHLGSTTVLILLAEVWVSHPQNFCEIWGSCPHHSSVM